MVDIGFTVAEHALSIGKYLFELKEHYQGLPSEIEGLRVLAYQIKELAERHDKSLEKLGEKRSAALSALLEGLEKAMVLVEAFVKDCKEHKVKNFLGSIVGKGAKEKLEAIDDQTKEIKNQLTTMNVEIAQMSFEQLQLLADSEGKKYDASIIIKNASAKQFWLKYAGKETFAFPSWESFGNSVRSYLSQIGQADLAAKFTKHQNILKERIAGTDGLVDVSEFDMLTSVGWPEGLANCIKEVENESTKMPDDVKKFLDWLGTLGLIKLKQYTETIIEYGVSKDMLYDLGDDLKKFLMDELNMSIIDANKIMKALAESMMTILNIGAPGFSYHPVKNDLYALTPKRDIVFCWHGENRQWERVGGPAGEGASAGGYFYASTPTKNNVFRHSGTALNWDVVTGAFQHLVEGGNFLYGVQQNGDIYKLQDKTWIKIGEPAAQFVATGDHLFALSTDNKTISHFFGEKWTKIGEGDYTSIIAGCDQLYAISSQSKDIYKWNGGMDWTKVGGPGKSFAVFKNELYRINPDGNTLWRLSSTNAWECVARMKTPLAKLLGQGFKFLFATDEATNIFTIEWKS